MSKIAMTSKIMIVGSDGRSKIFNFQLQYEYSSKVWKEITELDADKIDIGKICYHYIVIENEISYEVPGLYCVETNEPLGVYNEIGEYGNIISPIEIITDKGEYERRKFSNEDYAPDFAKQSLEMLGRRITNRYAPDVSMELQKLRNSANPKTTVEYEED